MLLLLELGDFRSFVFHGGGGIRSSFLSRLMKPIAGAWEKDLSVPFSSYGPYLKDKFCNNKWDTVGKLWRVVVTG